MTELTDALAPENAEGGGGGRGSSNVDLATDDTKRTHLRDAWRLLRRRPIFWVAAFLIAVFVSMTIVPQLFTAIAPGEGNPSGEFCFLADSRQGPSADHWFGTDVQGCDYYTQVTYGARISLRVALGATAITLTIGILLGSLAGYYSGFIDTLISRLIDGFLALPYLVAAIIVLSVLASNAGRNEWHVMAAIGALGWPAVVRLYRASVLQVKSLEYVQAAKALGASDARILARHVLPNALAPVLVEATTGMGVVISVEATLTFFGVGLPLDSASWGIMIAEATGRFENSPHLLLFPGAYLFFGTLGFIIMGELLREALDPRLR